MKSYYFALFDSSEENKAHKATVQELGDILKDVGIKIDLYKSILSISVDEETFKKKTTRNAGRRKNYRISPYTYGDIKKWKEEGQSVNDIISKLKVPRATYYRRMKKAKEHGFPDDWKFS